MITHRATQTMAIRLTHLYFAPSVHGPASNLSPIRQRRNTGIDVRDVETDHRDRGDGEERDRKTRVVALDMRGS